MVIQGKARTKGVIFLFLYIAVILFCLYLGFNRLYYLGTEDLRYDLTLDPLPFTFPQGRMFQLWIFEVGNFLAFLPFGIMLPLLFRMNFPKFIILFLIMITMIELVQLITRLGVFDVNDIAINTLGATVGYLSQAVVRRRKDGTKNVIVIYLMALFFATTTFITISYYNCHKQHTCPETIWSIDFVATQIDGPVFLCFYLLF